MGILLLRSNNLPPLRILYICLLTYSSNIEVPSALSGPSAFPPTLTSYLLGRSRRAVDEFWRFRRLVGILGVGEGES